MNTLVSVLTNPGGRKVNEDYCCYAERNGFGCYILADGLGGHKKGELAAKTIGEAVKEAFTASPGLSPDYLKKYIEHARRAFNTVRDQSHAHANMKSTLVVLLLDGEKALWGHIGDSRLYHFHSGKMVFKTKDHSVPQMLADSGAINQDQIRFHEDRNRLTAAFDGSAMHRFVITNKAVDITSGDVFLLCSDGFWEYVTEPEMESDFKQAQEPERWLLLLEKRLLKRVESGNDNYSALAVVIGR